MTSQVRAALRKDHMELVPLGVQRDQHRRGHLLIGVGL
jgi:hypothetical protein